MRDFARRVRNFAEAAGRTAPPEADPGTDREHPGYGGFRRDR